jgi:hypothetical protein
MKDFSAPRCRHLDRHARLRHHWGAEHLDLRRAPPNDPDLSVPSGRRSLAGTHRSRRARAVLYGDGATAGVSIPERSPLKRAPPPTPLAGLPARYQGHRSGSYLAAWAQCSAYLPSNGYRIPPATNRGTTPPPGTRRHPIDVRLGSDNQISVCRARAYRAALDRLNEYARPKWRADAARFRESRWQQGGRDVCTRWANERRWPGLAQ